MKYFASLLIAGMLHLGCAAAAQAEPVREIEQLVQQFQRNIIDKDAAALGALFLPENNSWLTVLDDQEFAAAKAKHADMPRVRPSSYKGFVKFIGESKLPVEEKFYNVRIHTNGYIGTVYFDFDFLEDGKVTNRGAESWHVVRTEQGWKISSMVFSIGR
ncbi:hypothetical protein [Pseudoduganella rhizocola]|uniref:hypothetical protein n=1 Tax=Pseudoduganella rhizocola TaxID=3382643 RepID=UPI0038B54E2A